MADTQGLQVCSICTESIYSDSCITPCIHQFHYRCLSLWLQRSQTCPQCRLVTYLDNLVRTTVHPSLPKLPSYEEVVSITTPSSSKQIIPTARKICNATLVSSNSCYTDFPLLHLNFDNANFLVSYIPAYVSNYEMRYEELGRLKTDCVIDVPCAYDMTVFKNLCTKMDMRELTWIVPEGRKFDYDRFCKVLRSCRDVPRIQRIIERTQISTTTAIKTITFIHDTPFETLKVTRLPHAYIIIGPNTKICYLIDDNRMTMNIQELGNLADRYRFDYVFIKIDLRKETADEIFKVQEILRPKKTVYIVPHAIRYESDVNKIQERLEERCQNDTEISYTNFELLSCGKNYENKITLNEPETVFSPNYRSRPRGFYNVPRGQLCHSCTVTHNVRPSAPNEEDEQEDVFGRRETGWLLGMVSGPSMFLG